LTGCVVEESVRKGKQLALKLLKRGTSTWLFVHLGMAGSIVVEGEKQIAYRSFTIGDEEWPPRHTKIVLELDGEVRSEEKLPAEATAGIRSFAIASRVLDRRGIRAVDEGLDGRGREGVA
jgi:formamidopyrimidine-DNA glycosylase